MIQSMTGFSSRSFSVGSDSYRIEVKSLNHRFLDLKLRLPRELQFLELKLKPIVESKVHRGSVELLVERQTQKSESNSKINEGAMLNAIQELTKVKNALGQEGVISVSDVLAFPDVVERNSGVLVEKTDEEKAKLQNAILAELDGALVDLNKMRSEEGAKLKKALLDIVAAFKKCHSKFLEKRNQIQVRTREKIQKRVEQCFEAYPTADERIRALMETRIAQEIAYTLEKLDIEEELTRFIGHVEAIEKLLTGGGQVGKKLDFLFQELNREINTLGNKSQDLGVSEEVIQLKTWIEQMREQTLNLE